MAGSMGLTWRGRMGEREGGENAGTMKVISHGVAGGFTLLTSPPRIVPPAQNSAEGYDVLFFDLFGFSPRPAERDPRHYACGCIRGYRRLSRLRRLIVMLPGREAPQERRPTVAGGGASRNPRRGGSKNRRVE